MEGRDAHFVSATGFLFTLVSSFFPCSGTVCVCGCVSEGFFCPLSSSGLDITQKSRNSKDRGVEEMSELNFFSLSLPPSLSLSLSRLSSL
ncbi:uncharacterized protein LY79DRAFT_564687 [Colletotrichum navitas]|uniref:Secreted protein n=1 Tax=Colletotrichum navitas TaxID=681940 RepID=A0AAD8PR72_9PEZI|nr:uncharacterized protein LY79DRAFT_564687 [Colletotrichum navitas]KAK1579211.1 hypothetical protein LY79DRAFT_564687 [Colletotrichum navitas]